MQSKTNFTSEASPPQNGTTKSKASATRNAFAAAFCLFLTINFLACSSLNQPTAEPNLSEKTFSWWTLHDLNRLDRNPNIVLLGSSLMVAAIAECDANFKDKMLDMTAYRDASYLSAELKKKFGGSFSSLNLAAPGQMPSDAYLTLSAALQRGVHPQVIVYGLAPRDFMDGTMHSLADTETFHVISHVVNTDEYAFDYFLTPMEKVNWLLQKNCALYRSAATTQSRILQACAEWVRPKLNQCAGLPDKEYEPVATAIRRKLVPGNVEIGSFVALPTKLNTPLLDNTADYKERYRNPSHDIYKTQFKFLQRVADLCKQNNIKLILVQMPIMKRNVSLLKESLYKTYKADLLAVSKQKDLPLFDLCNFDQYDQTDYKDTVHLNGFGGKKFVNHLVDTLSATSDIRTHLEAASRQKQDRSIATASSEAM